MKTFSGKYYISAVMLIVLSWTSATILADIVLHPGYLEGTFTIGDYNVHSANISASGDGYSASKSVTGDSYSLTVEGGEWDYSVGANIYVRPTDAYYPYTYMIFNNRNSQVPIGSTVINDYAYGTGTQDAAATVRFEVDIIGDAYNSWIGYGYARQNVSPDLGERTYSQSYTNSSYSPTATWDMPVLPNDNVRIYASIRLYNIIDGRGYYTYYNFWTTTPYRYENITAGELLTVPLTINHVAPTPDIPPDPPEYEYGSVEGTVELATLPGPDDFTRHRVRCGSPYRYSDYVTDNPGGYFIDYLQTGLKTCQVYSWFEWLFDGRSYSQSLTWPYTEGDYLNNRVEILADQTLTKDFYNEAGKLEGELTFSGTLENQTLNQTLYFNGAGDFYEFVDGAWVRERQSTYGGYTVQSKSISDPNPQYQAYLTQGPWLPYRVYSSFNDTSQGYSRSFSLNIYDYNYYYDGMTYDFGEPANIQAGSTTVQDRDYCTGSVIVRFRDESGGLLSYPSLNASGNRYNDAGKRDLSASMSGSSNVRNVLEPVIELHGPTADYNLSNIRFQTEDGTYLTFPGFPITLECGVRKGVPISGKPVILVDQPSAYHLTNALSILVSGTAADDNGIADMTINGNPIDYTLTGNPDNEVSFSHDTLLDNGDNIIVTTATDVDGNESFDERPVHVDRWQPSVTIDTPPDGAVFADPTATVLVEVSGSDQGYGFTVKLYYDGSLISEASGPGNHTAAESITLGETIGPMPLGSHEILAEIIDDAGNSASQSITITTNTFPVATDDIYSTPEDVPLNITAPGVLGNDTDADGNTLSVTASTLPVNGDLVANPDGSFIYTPNQNYHGTDSFTYTIADGNSGSDTATVSITITPVNDAPVADNDAYTTAEDTILSVAAPGVLANDADIEGDNLTAFIDSMPSNGTLVLNADGYFDYTPGPNYHGTDGFTYTVSDGQGGSDTAQVSLTVTPVNDSPVADEDVYTTAEDTMLSIAAPGVLNNDNDIDGDTITTVIVSEPTHGTLVLNTDGSFDYTPNSNYYGSDSFTYSISDGNGGSDTAMVSLTITPVNDLPVADDDVYTTAEDTILSIDAPGVLNNDEDIDGDTLTAVIDSGPAHGTLVLNASGSFNYMPAPNFNGADSFTYTASDGQGGTDVALVNLTITSVNDPPVADNDAYNMDEDMTLSLTATAGVLANDSDVDGNSLTTLLISGPANGALTLNADGSFTYSPNQDFNGSDSFTYRADDGVLQSSNTSAIITVNPVNDPPVVEIDLASQSVQYSDLISPVTITAYDIDSEMLLLTPTGLPESLVTTGGCTTNGDGSNCMWTLEGQTLVGTGAYIITLAVNDSEYAPSVTTELIVNQEDASAVFDNTNPVYVLVASDSGDSSVFNLVTHVTESVPDLPTNLAAPGDTSMADVTMRLVPMGTGSTVAATTCVPDNSVEGTQTVTCSFSRVPVETYRVEVTIGGNYYTGSAENTLLVYLEAAYVQAQPESRNGNKNGKMTIFAQLPQGLTQTASLVTIDYCELSSGSCLQPVSVKYSADEDKLLLKFNRSVELMADPQYVIRGSYCPSSGECYTWQGMDETKH